MRNLALALGWLFAAFGQALFFRQLAGNRPLTAELMAHVIFHQMNAIIVFVGLIATKRKSDER